MLTETSEKWVREGQGSVAAKAANFYLDWIPKMFSKLVNAMYESRKRRAAQYMSFHFKDINDVERFMKNKYKI